MPEAGQDVVCTPSTYDPAGGNIFYSHDENGEDETSGDFTIRLGGELSIDYDRERPGDDVYVSPADDQDRFHGAVWIAPGEVGEYAGDISLYSSADVTSNGRGIFAGHYGKSGALRMEVSGGDIATTGAGSIAIIGFRAEGSDGELVFVVRDVTIDTAGANSYGVWGSHEGDGGLNLDAQHLAIDTAGASAYGVYGSHDGDGELNIDTQELTITTAGFAAPGVSGWHRGDGELNVDTQDLAIDTAGANSYGVWGIHQGGGELNIDTQELTITTAGFAAHGVWGIHQGGGELNIDTQDLAIDTAGANSYGVWGLHEGDGGLNLDAQDLAIDTAGERAHGIYGRHDGAGELVLSAREAAIGTAGESAYGVIGWHQGDGELNVATQGLDIDTEGEHAYGVTGLHQGDGGLNLDAQDLAIDTAGERAYGVHGLHQGDGELNIDTRDLTIDTAGANSYGVWGLHEGDGGLNLDAQDLAIDTAGERAYGVHGLNQGDGELNIDTQELTVATAGFAAHGVWGIHRGGGELNIATQDLDIDTAGVSAYGVWGIHQGDGELNVATQDLAIDTAGERANGVFGWHQGNGGLNLDARDLDIDTAGVSAYGIYGRHDGAGEFVLSAQETAIGTAGERAHGVFGWHQGAGDLGLDVRGASVTTAGARASGIYGNHFSMDGDVAVRVRDGDVSTAGTDAFGVRGFHSGPGTLDIDLRETTVATTGEGSHGVVIYRSGSGAARIAVDGGSVRAAGTGASGIQIGHLRNDGNPELTSPVGEDGYRAQSVSVNAPVTGGSGEGAAGVFLAGGGRVTIGPRGQVGAVSGVAIMASGGAPKLAVEMDLDGRRPGDVVDGAIRNDGGETTVVVNGVTLHEGATGATGARAANGAWDLSVSAGETIAGRTFAPEDFMESYAPRAAVYEALPGFVLRLDGARPSGTRIARPGSPAWAQVSGGRGSYEPGRASAGAAYDFRRFSAEAGLDVALGGNVTCSFSLRHVSGTAEVASPYGGGAIEAEGLGAAAGLSWSGADGHYARGRVAITSYEMDVSSGDRGSLARDVEARGHSLGVEAGRRIAVGETVTLTPRAWAARRWLSGGAFTDAAGARVSLDETTRYTGGVGLSAETARTLEDGTLALRASADVERALGGADTAARVSGESLESEASATRVLLGLGGAWRKGRFSLGARLAAGGPGSGDTEHSGWISLGWTF